MSGSHIQAIVAAKRVVRVVAGLLLLVSALWAATTAPARTLAASSQEPPPVVRSVLIDGNRRVDRERILGAITRTQPGQPLDRQAVEADLKAILDLGFFRHVSVDVQPITATSTEGAPEVRVIFRVVENPVLKAVEVKPDPALAPVLDSLGIGRARLAALVDVPTGQVAHGPTISQKLDAVASRMWQELGVLGVPQEVDLTDDGVLVVGLSAVKVGGILIEGNEKTKDHVIRRELTLRPGDVLVRSELEKSLRRVLMLQFFDEVNADLRPASAGDRVDVVVRVTERRTGMVQVGLTYSGGAGLGGLVQVSDINFMGRGQTVGVTANVGQTEQRYEISFTEPYIDARRTSVGIKLGYERQEREYFDVRYGGELTVGRPLSEYTRGSVTFVNHVWAPEGKGGNPPPDSAERGTLRSVRLAAVTDTSDHPFNPTTGNRLRLSAELAGLGGDFRFNKYETTVTHYLPIRIGGSTHVLAGRISAGTILSREDVPDQVIFKLGGSESLRGYTLGSPDFLKGSTMIFANLEYRFPIVKPVSGVVFVDAGRAWASQDKVDLRQVVWDAGVGIRIDVPPLGMIRLDYGMTREHPGQFHFSIGQAF